VGRPVSSAGARYGFCSSKALWGAIGDTFIVHTMDAAADGSRVRR
jgi:hypothetical protein